ncbi:MAG: hypothetical protein ACKVVP_02715, partial [Chloroflexota bacterium]
SVRERGYGLGTRSLTVAARSQYPALLPVHGIPGGGSAPSRDAALLDYALAGQWIVDLSQAVERAASSQQWTKDFPASAQ